jgi:hypothetical protein
MLITVTWNIYTACPENNLRCLIPCKVKTIKIDTQCVHVSECRKLFTIEQFVKSKNYRENTCISTLADTSHNIGG